LRKQKQRIEAEFKAPSAPAGGRGFLFSGNDAKSIKGRKIIRKKRTG
jgi:hypothetical protein